MLGKEAYILTYRHEGCGNEWTEVIIGPPDSYIKSRNCPKCYPAWLSAGGYKRKPVAFLIDIRYEGPSIIVGGK